ncbi:MAG: 3-hydroxyacyl-CoA dehydrogenase [Alphaproteobacteria bacterium]|nr:3-hydroxyacyl-CoA dehydrogenase [Alphaproteobacteria bacterium]
MPSRSGTGPKLKIGRVGVIGSGVMGGGIAAHVANAGVPVHLLDIVPKDGGNRNAVAEGAIQRLIKTDPAPFMHSGAARLVTPGNLEDHLDRLGECDWIVEVVAENLQIKQDVYRKIEAHRKAGSIVSSNTSTIPLQNLTKGMPKRFAKDFLITHFFNPPRYMRLLEIVAGPDTKPKAVEIIRDFCDYALGKGVVDCKDTPGFIANRIGTYWIQAAINHAIDQGLSVEEADAVAGRPMGIPKTGIFGLLDLVGLDLMPHVSKSLLATLPEGDDYRRIYRPQALFEKMIADGYTGRKGKGGFYRLAKGADGSRVKEAINLMTGTYHPAGRPRIDSVEAARKGLKVLAEHPDKGGRYAWAVLRDTLSYAVSLVPDIADQVTAVDEAMRLGYAWKRGPFEMIDQLGAKWFAEKLAGEGRAVPALLKTAADAGSFYRLQGSTVEHLGTDGAYREIVRRPGVLLLADVKRGKQPIVGNRAASLWDLGDGVACLEFHTKMNAFDADLLGMVKKAVDTVAKSYKALVIHNDSDNFSVGANLGLALFAANVALWPAIDQLVDQGQKTFKALKYAPFPSVGAPSGMALGGGCEVLLHCSAIQAHAESYIGLVECGVGLVPGWGGSKELLTRWATMPGMPKGPMPPVAKAFETVAMAKVGKSAHESKELGFLRPADGITMNRDRLLADAKETALRLAKRYKAPEPQELRLPGPTGVAAISLQVEGLALQGKVTRHDQVVVAELAKVVTGGEDADHIDPIGEDKLYALERQAFMRLVKTEGTLARMEHMLTTGKPLRN